MARSKGRLDLGTLLGEEEMWTMEQKKRSGCEGMGLGRQLL